MQLDANDIEILKACVNNATIKGESAQAVAQLLAKLEFMQQSLAAPTTNGAALDGIAHETDHA